MSSFRAEAVDEEVASLLVRAGVRTLTVAPENGTEALRAIAGKPMRDEALLDAAAALAAAGMERLKLYFMIGLPGERDEDVQAIPALVRSAHEVFAKGRRGARVSVGVSPFVPKPRTPFQWLPMAPERDTAGEALPPAQGALGATPRGVLVRGAAGVARGGHARARQA